MYPRQLQPVEWECLPSPITNFFSIHPICRAHHRLPAGVEIFAPNLVLQTEYFHEQRGGGSWQLYFPLAHLPLTAPAVLREAGSLSSYRCPWSRSLTLTFVLEPQPIFGQQAQSKLLGVTRGHGRTSEPQNPEITNKQKLGAGGGGTNMIKEEPPDIGGKKPDLK